MPHGVVRPLTGSMTHLFSLVHSQEYFEWKITSRCLWYIYLIIYTLYPPGDVGAQGVET